MRFSCLLAAVAVALVPSHRGSPPPNGMTSYPSSRISQTRKARFRPEQCLLSTPAHSLLTRE